MTLYDTELAKASRTPQMILEVAVPYCANHYASGSVLNRLLRTEEFDNVAWVKTSVEVVANAATDPLGGQAADALTFNADGDAIEQASDLPAASQPANSSVWLKAASGTPTITMRIENTAATVETQDQQIQLTTAWQRFSISRTFAAGAGGNVNWKLYRKAGDTINGDVHAWGAQLSPGLDLFSYVKNVSTRNACSTCLATDQGDGKRCFYSFPTCQDKAHFNVLGGGPADNLRLYKFCRQDAAHPLPGERIWPYVRDAQMEATQEIDPEHAVTVSDRVRFVLLDDAGPGLWDAEKASEGAKTNTALGQGSFMRRWLAIHKNYANPTGHASAKVGFVASGMTEDLFQQRFRGLLRNVEADQDGNYSFVCVDRLKLLKAKAPASISTSNVLAVAMDGAQTTCQVTNAAEFTLPGSGYTVVIKIESEEMNVTAVAGNVFTVQRGRWGTTAAAHAIGKAVAEVLEAGTERSTPSLAPVGKNVIDVVVELLRRSGLAAADIDTTRLYSERDTWLPSSVDPATGIESGAVIRRTATDSSDIEGLMAQIRDAFMIFLWVGEDQKVTGRTFAPAQPTEVLTELTDGESIVANSLQVDDNDESRITRVVFAWDLIAGKTGDKISDYNRVTITAGADEESAGYFGDVRAKVILSRWIEPGSSGLVDRLSQHIFDRYRQGARKVTLDVELKDDSIKTGDFVKLTTARLQDQFGVPLNGRIMQVLKKERPAWNRQRLTLLDTGLFKRYWFFAPAGHPDYDAATSEQRRYGFFSDATGHVGAAADDPYCWW